MATTKTINTLGNVTLTVTRMSSHTYILTASNEGWDEVHTMVSVDDNGWFITADIRENHPEYGMTVLAQSEMDSDTHMDKGGNALNEVFAHLSNALFTDLAYLSEYNRRELFALVNGMFSYLRRHHVDLRLC